MRVIFPFSPVRLLPDVFAAIHAEIMGNILRKVNLISAYSAALMCVIHRIAVLLTVSKIIKFHTINGSGSLAA